MSTASRGTSSRRAEALLRPPLVSHLPKCWSYCIHNLDGSEAVALAVPILTISNPSSPSLAFAQYLRCLLQRGCKGTPSPPKSLLARMAQHFYLCCGSNAVVFGQEKKK